MARCQRRRRWMSSEQLPLELRASPPRKHLAIGAVLAAAIALAIALAEAADSYLWIAIGSALGGMARHWCNALATAWLGPSFPWGTLFINVTRSEERRVGKECRSRWSPYH